MTDELPEIFDALKPPRAMPELRERVLSAVNRELARRRKPAWERAFELGVAACLALGIGLNAWQWRGDLGWQDEADQTATEIAGRDELVAAVASITDKATAEMLLERLVSARDRSSADAHNGSIKN